MRSEFLPYFRPEVGEPEIAAVSQALRNGWLTSGPNVGKIESEFARRSGVEHAVALSSCTAALHLALRAMDVGPGDEVVMPSLTFVAGAQCTLELGATPVFADIDPSTLSITLETVDAVVTPRTKVIMTMPYAGRPLGAVEIVDYARTRRIRVLEDAAHATGTLDCGRWPGTVSDAAALSFYATKNITSAEGGMLLTNDAGLAERVRLLSLHGMSRDAWKRYHAGGSWRYDVVEPGYKYNLADPLAALGLKQFESLDAMQARRDEIARRYQERIREIPGLSLQAPPSRPNDRHSWCMFVVIIDDSVGVDRDGFIEALTAAKIGTSVHYIPTHLFSAYRALQRSSLPNTELAWQRLVSLPLYPSMSDSDVEDVLEAVELATHPNLIIASSSA